MLPERPAHPQPAGSLRGGMHLPVGLAAVFPQRARELLAVLIMQLNVLALIPPVEQMIRRSRILNAQLAWHGTRLNSPAPPGQW